jgi:hypothetical protein
VSHAEFVRLWQETRIGEPLQAVLARWPKNPYQHYPDRPEQRLLRVGQRAGDALNDMAQNLYNFCFKDGALRAKELM